ncbi:MAG: hypothetical protein SFX18_13965 [Pirellulales bacterium]|nr:hypothetical protein [Pirellulales bacterium]
MLSRAELTTLQAPQEYPAVSILAPTHRTAPANKQDPIKVKNLVTKAIDRLQTEFKKREVADVVKNLKELVKGIAWRHTLDGLALFVSRTQATAVQLPFRVKPRVQLDRSFATRDLVYAYNRAVPYRILSLGHTSRLFDAWTTVLEEHTAKPFPLEHQGAGGSLKLPGGEGINRSAVRDDHHRKYFKTVADAVAAIDRERPLPLVIVGVERNLAFYQEVAKNAELCTLVAGNHERTNPADLGKLVWPIFDQGNTARRTKALVELDAAVGAKRSASGIQDVWNMAADGQCRVLLVEKEYKHPANLHTDGRQLLKYTGKGAEALDDAVDEVIERVLATGGEVFFYGLGDLEGHSRIAAISRKG